jgi:hypothetical protein
VPAPGLDECGGDQGEGDSEEAEPTRIAGTKAASYEQRAREG